MMNTRFTRQYYDISRSGNTRYDFRKLITKNYNCGRSKPVFKRKISPSIKSIIKKEPFKQNTDMVWVSASKIRNYILDNGLSDWLSLYDPTKNILSNAVFRSVNNTPKTFSEIIFNKGFDFESSVIKHIGDLCHVEVILENGWEKGKINDGVKKTIKFMKDGVPVIAKAPFKNYINQTHGEIDLIVRSDYLEYIFENYPMTVVETKNIGSPLLGHKNFHYVAIDIKYSTIKLMKDNIHVQNSGLFRYYKCQLNIYNEAIAAIQGYKPSCSFLIGKRYKSCNMIGETCFSYLGTINYEGDDKNYVQITRDAILWRINLEKYGHTWTIDPPSHPMLLPNPKIPDEWTHKKQVLANKYNLPIKLWFCSFTKTKAAYEKGITSIQSSDCTAESLGFSNTSFARARIIDSIIKVNKTDNQVAMFPETLSPVYKCALKRDTPNEIFVDFEWFPGTLISDTNPEHKKASKMLFMIGIYCDFGGEKKFITFTSEKPTFEEERRILIEFIEFMRVNDYPRLFYWHAEKHVFLSTAMRQGINFFNGYSKWVDICHFVTNTPIVVKGCYNFKLKDYTKALYNNGLISYKMDSDCKNGEDAFILAYNCYNSEEKPLESKVMKDIIKYNEFDCEVMYHVLSCFRDKYAC